MGTALAHFREEAVKAYRRLEDPPRDPQQRGRRSRGTCISLTPGCDTDHTPAQSGYPGAAGDTRPASNPDARPEWDCTLFLIHVQQRHTAPENIFSQNSRGEPSVQDSLLYTLVVLCQGKSSSDSPSWRRGRCGAHVQTGCTVAPPRRLPTIRPTGWGRKMDAWVHLLVIFFTRVIIMLHHFPFLLEQAY